MQQAKRSYVRLRVRKSSHLVPSALAENWLNYWISCIGLPPTENPSSFYCERSGLKWTEVDNALKKCCIFAPNFNLHNSDIWSSHLPFISHSCPIHVPLISHTCPICADHLAAHSLLFRYSLATCINHYPLITFNF